MMATGRTRWAKLGIGVVSTTIPGLSRSGRFAAPFGAALEKDRTSTTSTRIEAITHRAHLNTHEGTDDGHSNTGS
jgi:hypothetical protein